MKKRMCSVVGGLLVLATCGAFAQDPPQVLWNNAVDGAYTDGSMWSSNRVPWVGMQGRFTQGGDYTITFGQGFLDDVSMTAYDAGAGGTLTFDTRGSSWIKPANSNLISDHTFRMNGAGGHSFNIETTGGGGGNNLLQFELTDALMTVERDASLITTTLHSGLFNLYDAGGDAASGVRLVFGHSGGTKHHAVWKAGSTSRLRQVDFRGSGSENIFFYEGGTHTVFGNFLQGSTDNTRGEVRSTGGLLDVRTDFRVGNNPNSKMALLVDGGTVNTHNLFIALASNTVGTVVVSNGSLTVNNNLELANHLVGRAEIRVEGGEFAVRNAYIGHRGTGTVEVASGRLVSGNEISVGRESTGVGELILSGGSLIQSNSSLRVASTVGAQGTLRVTGGDHLIRDLNVAPDGGIGHAELSGGFVTTRDVGFQTGINAASTNSVLVVSGGKHTVRGGVGISVGSKGLGYMEISGGEVDCYTYVRIGYNGAAAFAGYDKANTNRISTLKMSGNGILRVLGDTLNVADAPENNAARIILDGGSVYARNVRGWRGSACRSGQGYSELSADGGRVVPLTQEPTDVFMETFDLAMLGDAGLTVDTDGSYARINQTFIPKPGTRGRLVKVGVGILRLGGASTIGDIEVNGGTLAFQAADVFTGRLVVTNSATVSLQESGGSGFTLAGLTLGDASLISGRLLLRNTDTITITEPNGLNVINGKVFLADPAADGVYTLFRCAGAVTLPAGLELGNGISTKDYAWSTASGPSGTTEIILTISDRVATAPIEWSGTVDSQWDNAGNWGGQPPAKGQRALFPENAVRENVTVTTGAVAGELDFDSSASYTLSGETLTLDNSGRVCLVNVVGQGTHAITAPLALKRLTTIDTDSTAAITLGSVTGEGSILKGGAGLLTLNGSDNFTGSLTVQNGILALASADAFGVPSADSERWTLAGGTLRYAGGNAARDNSIAVDVGTRAADAAVVFDVGANDLALNGTPKVNKGALIKRGAGTLAFNVSGSSGILSAGHGKITQANAHPNYLIAFAADGQPPTDGYTGFNIAEGKVRITNTDAAAPVMMRHAADIGLQTCDGTTDPELEIDHATVRQGDGGYHLHIGSYTPVGSAMTNPVLRLVNNATLEANTLQFGQNSSGEVYPKLIMDASTATISWAINVRQSIGTTSIMVTNKSAVTIASDNLNFEYPVHFLLDDSLLQLNSTGSGGIVIFSGNAAGSFTLRNGARMRYMRFRVNNPPMNFTFDGGTLEPRLDDTVFAFRGDNTRPTVELLNQGLAFDIPSGMTYTLARNMTGSGKFRKAGAGRLTFAGLMQETEASGVFSYTPLNISSNTPIDDYTGGTWVDAGTLAVSNGTIRADRRITVAQGATLELGGAVAAGTLAGNGTITGGSLTQGTLAPGSDDGETGSLTLDGTTLSGVTFACDIEQDADKTVTASDKLLGVGTASNVIVDFGRTATDPLLTPCSVVIGTYDTANPPAVNTWKVSGIGRNSTIGSVEASGGILTVNVRFSGFLLMLR